jgi:hypothetical protein
VGFDYGKTSFDNLYRLHHVKLIWYTRKSNEFPLYFSLSLSLVDVIWLFLRNISRSKHIIDITYINKPFNYIYYKDFILAKCCNVIVTLT